MAERTSTQKPTPKQTKPKSSSSGSSKSTSKKKSKKTSKKTTKKKPSSASSRTVSLRTDLGKDPGEEYDTTELLRGAMILVEREGADVLHSAVMAVLAANIPLAGDALAKEAADSIIRQFTDDYKKLTSDDRKAVRGVLRWLTGDFTTDTRTTNELVAALSAPPAPTAEAPPAPAPAGNQLAALTSGFVLPPKPSVG